MRPTTLARNLGCLFLVAVTAACSGGSGQAGGTTKSSGGNHPAVHLTFWSWVPNIDKVVGTWNAAHPDIQVTVSKPAQGDALVTKILAAHRAGNPPDLMQAEYQALPTLVTDGAAADLTDQLKPAGAQFSDAVWNQVTFGGKRYAVPQDIGPMMFFYRKDLFATYHLQVPTTWEQYASEAEAVHARDPKVYLGGFSAADPGWFSGLAAQAGSSWWSFDGNRWSVGVNDAASTRVAGFWSDLVSQGVIDTAPWWTPEWNAKFEKGTLLSWVSAVWAPGVIAGNAPGTKGRWAMAPLPQWQAGAAVTGYWGGSSTAVASKSVHKDEAAQFALWLNTDPTALQALVTQGSIYPAATAGQSVPALSQTPAVLAPDQADFYSRAATIAGTARGFTWGPDVNVAYSAYNDAFGKAVQNHTAFPAALTAIQSATVSDMTKAGFTVAGS